MSVTFIPKDDTLPRQKYDTYFTDPGFVKTVLNEMLPPVLFVQNILDPGAGRGSWGSVAKNMWPHANVYGIDIQEFPKNPNYDTWVKGDFLNYNFTRKFDLILGNPPYKNAEEFVRKSWELLPDGGILVFLLRLSFLEGIKRGNGLWKEIPLKTAGVCSRRPSFQVEGGHYKKGRTYPGSFCVFLWEKGYNSQPVIEWVNTS